MQTAMTLEEIEEFILERLPRVLERDPRFVTFIEGIVAEKFPRRDEFAMLIEEVKQHRTETAQQFQQVDQRFDKVDQRFDKVDQRLDNMEQRMEEGFRAMQSGLDRLGQRWGIRNESIFRQTMRELL